MASRPWGTIFGRGCAHDSPRGTLRSLINPRPIQRPTDELRPPPPPRLLPTRLGAPGAFRLPNRWVLFLGDALATTPHGYTEAPHKSSPHSDPDGRTSPSPPSKAIPYPSGGPWGLFGTPTLGHYFCPRLWPQLPTGTLSPLTKPHSIPSPADEHRLHPLQGYSPPVSGPLGPFGTPTFGHDFCTWLFP